MKRRSRNLDKNKILLIGPYPPSVGGVSNFIHQVNKSKLIKTHFNLDVFITKIKNNSTNYMNQALIEIRQFFRFLFKLRIKTYNIVHINSSSFISFYRSFIYLFLAKNFFNINCVLHIHGGGFIKFYQEKNLFLKIVIKYAFNISDLIIVTSQSWVQKIKDISEPDNEIEILNNGYEKEIFYPMDQINCRKMLGLPINKKIILSIGALIPVKNHLLLIEAIKKLIIENGKRDFFFIIVGDGHLRSLIIESIQNNNLEELITIIPNISQEEINYWINASDIMVLPSIHEGNPTVMFECLACGKPFVGSKVGGIPDIIKSEEYGLLFEPNNIDDVVKKILIALDKNWDRNKIVEYGNKFSFDEIASDIVKIYSHLIDNY